MRIIWTDNNEFQAEISLTTDWRQDVDLLKAAGFRTSGPPEWRWTTAKASTLNKLRNKKPSNLTVTETALEKYKLLNEREQQKADLKKQFEKAKKQAAQEINSANWKDYIDSETGIVCKHVEPLDTKFVPKYTIAPPPEVYCFVCGSALYYHEAPDVCLFCEF